VPRGMRRRSIAGAGLALASAILLGAFLLARGPADSDYFGPNEPTWVRVPTTIGDPVYVGILVLRAQPGDAIELESVHVEGRIGDPSIEPIVRILPGPSRILGAIAASDLGDTIDLSTYTTFSTLRFSEAGGPVELAVRVVGSAPLHGFDGVRLRFTINGDSAPIEDWIPLRASICTGRTFAEAVDRCGALVKPGGGRGIVRRPHDAVQPLMGAAAGSMTPARTLSKHVLQ